MVGQLSRLIFRFLFEDVIMVEYLDRENEVYRDEYYNENDYQMMNEGGVIIIEIGLLNGKVVLLLKCMIVVMFLNLLFDFIMIKKKKDNVIFKIELLMKCKELCDFEVKEMKL